MWQLAEPDYDNYNDRRSYKLLYTGLLLSVIAHSAVLVMQVANEHSWPLRVLNVSLDIPQSLPEEARPQEQQTEEPRAETQAQTQPAEQAARNKAQSADTPIDQARAKAQESASAEAFVPKIDIQQAIREYIDAMPEVYGQDLDGRVFDPVLAAKIYEARKNSKARPGFGPGSYEQGVEGGLQDPGSYQYSGGLSQRWVKVDGKCFLVHDDAGVGALRGAFNTWMRTSCKKFNPQFFDNR